MLMLLAFLICREHLSGYYSCPWCREMINMLVGWQAVRGGAFSIQNCLLAFLHVLN